MEEKGLTKRISDTFDEVLPILENARKGFVMENAAMIKESIARFRELLRSRVAFSEAILKKKEKDEAEIRYVSMITPLQIAALGIENVMEKMAIKVEAKVPFTHKALKEIRSLQLLVYSQLADAREYVMSGDPQLKANIRKNMEEIKRLAGEYELVHQDRLITGICMPKASYLYIDITDSLKRAARAMVDFSEKV
jgi:Na+/phosphate symporter